MSGENEPLLGSTSTETKKEKKKKEGWNWGILSNRILLLLTLAALITASYIFNTRMQSLISTVETEHTAAVALQKKVNEQEGVIKRFNSSVTNADVLVKVSRLEEELEGRVGELRERLAETQKHVEEELRSTLAALNESVSEAQDRIQREVDSVHLDVETYVRTTQDQFSMENDFMIYQLAGTFTLLGSLISMWHMTSHLRHFYQPSIQRKILAILWMCPIYSVTSWLSLVFVNLEGYLGILKDFYEAYVIYTFLSFLISVLAKGDRKAVVNLLAADADHLSSPRVGGCFCKIQYDSAHDKAEAVLLQCQLYAMQFVFFKPLISIALFAIKKGHLFPHHNTSTDFKSPVFYLVLLENISVFMAFSGLLKFYHAVHHHLEWCKPWPKFLCIKGVVFMTFWQGLTIAILASTAVDFGEESNENNNDDPAEWAARAQSFLICLEMLLFSIAHFYVFPYQEWNPEYKVNAEKQTKIGDTLAVRDFVSDLKLILSSGSRKKEKLKSISSTALNSEVDNDDVATDLKLSIHDSEYTTAREDDIDDDLKHVEESLEDALMTPKAEIRQAATRLLSTRMLQPDNDALESPEEETGQSHDIHLTLSSTENEMKCDELGETMQLLSTSSTTQNELNNEASETTQLLETSSYSTFSQNENIVEQEPEILNPSIFTALSRGKTE